jgi:hypothetical protein
MAGLPGKVKEIVLPLDEVTQTVSVTHVRDVNLEPVDPFNVVTIPSVIWNQAVNDSYLRTQAIESPREIGTNEAQATSDQNPGSPELVFHGDKIFQALQAAITLSDSCSVKKGWMGNDSSQEPNRRAFTGSTALCHVPSRKAAWSQMSWG